jgi:hypothetical protein
MTYYEAVAEAGPDWCKGPNKLVQCAGDMTKCKPADGIVMPDAHPGNGVESLRDLNPSVVVQKDGSIKVIADLDPFNPANGFNPNGMSHYSNEFRTRYSAAQSKVMNERITAAQAAMDRIKQGQYPYPDDDIVLIPGGGFSGAGAGNADLREMDTTVPEFMSTARPEKLLKNDGSIITQIVHSVMVPNPGNAKANRTFVNGTKSLLLHCTAKLSVRPSKVWAQC